MLQPGIFLILLWLAYVWRWIYLRTCQNAFGLDKVIRVLATGDVWEFVVLLWGTVPVLVILLVSVAQWTRLPYLYTRRFGDQNPTRSYQVLFLQKFPVHLTFMLQEKPQSLLMFNPPQILIPNSIPHNQSPSLIWASSSLWIPLSTNRRASLCHFNFSTPNWSVNWSTSTCTFKFWPPECAISFLGSTDWSIVTATFSQWSAPNSSF